MRILVVEDDSLLAQGLTRVLARAGHAVDMAETGVQADRALRAASYDLVVLDIGLPDIDGFEVLRRLRLRHAAANVLVLTARDAIEDRVHGLDLGADDYLTKPFSVTEFEARVRALLRRVSLPAPAGALPGAGHRRPSARSRPCRAPDRAASGRTRMWRRGALRNRLPPPRLRRGAGTKESETGADAGECCCDG